MYNYKQLLTFVTIIEENSFTAAAKKLFITQPAISWQIKSLEKSIGVQLIERSDNDLQLTPAGELLYQNARIIIDQYTLLKEDMDCLISRESNLIRLSASTIPGEYILPDLIKSFRKQHDLARIKLGISDSEQVMNHVLNGLASIGVLGTKPNHPDLTVSPFANETLQLVGSIDLSAKNLHTLERILKEPLIMREEGSGTRAATLEYIQRELPQYKSHSDKLVFGSTKACLSAIEAGLGIGWLSKYAIEDSLKLNRVKIISDAFDIPRQLFVITHKKRTLNETSEAFMNFIKLT